MPFRISGSFIVILFTLLTSNTTDANGAAREGLSRARTSPSPSVKSRPSARKRPLAGSSAPESCVPCEAAAATRGKAKRTKAQANALPCHPKDYLDPKVARNYKTAIREMRRTGIKPKVTSMWRSSDYQAELHKCSLSRRCRLRKGVYGAMPPGNSLHEAGLAVDIAGLSAGSRGHRYLTPRGRRVVRIMEKNGFKWRYGLADPVHFEADPRAVGYRNAAQAIRRTQSTCQVKLAAARKLRSSRKMKQGVNRVEPAASTRVSRRRTIARATPTVRGPASHPSAP